MSKHSNLRDRARKQTSSSMVRRRLARAVLTAPAAAMVFGWAHSAGAASAYFDSDGFGTPSAASGDWNTTNLRWANSPSSSNYALWNNGGTDAAVFNGPGGDINLPTGINATGMSFSGGNYLLAFTTGGALTLNDATAPILDVASGLVVNCNLAIAGSNGITKNGAGQFNFVGSLITSGPVTVNQGTLLYSHPSADLTNASAVTINAAGTLDLGKINDEFGSLSGSGSMKLGSLNLNVNTGSLLTVGRDNSDTTFSGSISGVGGRFVKLGSGTMVLSGNNTNTGIVRLGATDATGNGGTLRLRGGNAISDSSAVFLRFSATGSTWASSLVIDASETIGSLGGGSVTSVIGGTGTVVNLAGGNLTVGADNRSNQYDGAVTGPGGIIKIGSGVQTFANSNSDYTGGVTVKDGIFLGSSDSRFGAVPAVPTDNAITLDGGSMGIFTSAQTINANRGITITANGGGIYTNSNLTYDGIVKGPGQLTKQWINSLLISKSQEYAGGTVINDGTVSSSLASTVASGNANTPVGTGSLTINGATLSLLPATGSADIVLALANGSTTTKMNYGAGATLTVGLNSNTSNTVTIGASGAPTESVINRNGAGTLVLNPTTGIATLGGTIKVKVNGGVTMTNGIVSPSIVGQNGIADGSGDFLAYDNTNGFVKATYSASTDINTAGATAVYTAAGGSNNTLTGPATVYALQVPSGQTVTATGQTLTVGNGSGAAGVILNNGATITGGTLAFGTSDGVIYGGGASASNVTANITGSAGITKMGTQAVVLTPTGALGYTGNTTVAGGTLRLGTNAALPSTTNVTVTGGSTLDLNGTTQSVSSLNSISTSAVVALGANGSLTLGAGSYRYDGSITGSGGASTLIKDGPGTLTFGRAVSVNGLLNVNNTFNKLVVKNGGVVSISNGLSLGAAPGAALADAITLDNGTIRITQLNAAALDSADTVSISSNRGTVLGPGGGTFDIVDPIQIVLYNGADASVISGVGALTKAGPGYLRVRATNTYTGGTVIAGGYLQMTSADGAPGAAASSLGAVPAALDDDNIILKTGGALANDSATASLAATRGILVDPTGGEIRNALQLTLNGPISGTGPLRKTGLSTGNSTLILNGSSPNYSGTITLATQGDTRVNANEALGVGTVTNDPAYQMFVTSTANDPTLSNNWVLNKGLQIDFRVSAGRTLTLNGKISGDAAWARGVSPLTSGNGTLVLNNSANDFTGPLSVHIGTVQLGADHVLGAATAAGHTNIAQNATLAIGTTAGGDVNYATPEPLYIAGTGVGGSAGAIRGLTGNQIFAGPVTMTNDAMINVEGNSLVLSGGVQGLGRLTKNGSGLLEVKNVRTSGISLGSANMKVTPSSQADGVSVLRSTSATPAPALDLQGRSLDITDNKVITTDPVGSAVALTYTDVSGLIQAGRNGNSTPLWDGNGIITSQTQATTSNFTSIGVATAQQVKSLATASDTAVWAGQTVTGSDTLVMYTYGGDANLDGKINVDDYGRIDLNIPLGTSGWFNGDFNYDGQINVDDYGIIDFNIGIQGAPFPTGASSGASGLSGVSAVPEPAGIAMLSLAGLSVLARRRRRPG